MTAAYRMRGLGWFMAVVIVVLGFYLVSLQVAAERKKLDDVERTIAATHRQIRGLETEFNTRANLAQLERWNGAVLALASPSAAQFVPDEVRLAQIDFRPGAVQAQVRNANYLVPALPVDADRHVSPPPAAAPETKAPAASVGGVGLASNTLRLPPQAAAPRVRPQVIAASATTPVVPARRVHTVAMLDRKLVNDSTLSDLLSRADIAVGKAR